MRAICAWPSTTAWSAGNPLEAEANARREFGNLGLVEEVTREMWSWIWLEQFWRDVRYGLRGMRRNPGFTAVAVIALALGIGAEFGDLHGCRRILLRPLGYRDPERLVVILNHGNGPVAPANFADWKAQSRSFDNMGAAEVWTPDISPGSDRPEKLWALRVSADIPPLLGVPPALGAFFTPDEDQPGREFEIVLGYALWQRQFGGDTNVSRPPDTTRQPHLHGNWSDAGRIPVPAPLGDSHRTMGAGSPWDRAHRSATGTACVCSPALKTRGNGGAGSPGILRHYGASGTAISRHQPRSADRSTEGARGRGNPSGAPDAALRGRICVVDCLRERGAYASGAFRRARSRGSGSHRAGRQPRPAPVPVPRREPDDGYARRRRGTAAGLLGRARHGALRSAVFLAGRRCRSIGAWPA